MIDVVAYAFVVPVEEQFMLDKCGTTYHDYMQRTPRWIGLPGNAPQARAA